MRHTPEVLRLCNAELYYIVTLNTVKGVLDHLDITRNDIAAAALTAQDVCGVVPLELSFRYDTPDNAVVHRVVFARKAGETVWTYDGGDNGTLDCCAFDGYVSIDEQKYKPMYQTPFPRMLITYDRSLDEDTNIYRKFSMGKYVSTYS